MLLLVGLGNPGSAYARQRHNVGFMLADRLAEAYRFGPWRGKWQSLLAEGQIGEQKVLLQKPQTFMNLSGEAVQQAVRFHKLPLDQIVVCHDELDLAAGKIRIKLGGGVAGHNGLRSIAARLGAKDFKRLRIGIGHPGHKELVTGHVLGNFTAEDQTWLQPLLDALVEAAPLLVAGDDAGAMNKVALRTSPAKEKPAKPDQLKSDKPKQDQPKPDKPGPAETP